MRLVVRVRLFEFIAGQHGVVYALVRQQNRETLCGWRTMVLVRPETEDDHSAVRAVNVAAFDMLLEADLVDVLREAATPLVSLVAEEAGAILGHIMFSPVFLEGHADLQLMGLAPMAVSPARQRSGIGSRLVAAGPSVKLMRAVAEAIKEDLGRVKDVAIVKSCACKDPPVSAVAATAPDISIRRISLFIVASLFG